MKHLKERRAGRLFPFKVYGKWWVCAGTLILVYFLFEDLQFSNLLPTSHPAPVEAAAVQETAPQINRQIAQASTTQLSAEARMEIENLFAEVRGNPENREELLLTLKRILQQTFEGQEDCWSCEGTEYFDRFDKIAGSGEARKPLGFREWIELGDDAFDQKQLDEARRFYGQALQVIDERALDMDESLDAQAVEKVRERCAQLGCQ